jgi:GNAT superfamily N-acetyltransferase
VPDKCEQSHTHFSSHPAEPGRVDRGLSCCYHCFVHAHFDSPRWFTWIVDSPRHCTWVHARACIARRHVAQGPFPAEFLERVELCESLCTAPDKKAVIAKRQLLQSLEGPEGGGKEVGAGGEWAGKRDGGAPREVLDAASVEKEVEKIMTEWRASTEGRQVVVGAVDISSHEFDLAGSWTGFYQGKCFYLSVRTSFLGICGCGESRGRCRNWERGEAGWWVVRDEMIGASEYHCLTACFTCSRTNRQDMAVSPNMRKLGIGGSLLSAALQFVRTSGGGQVFLHVEESNDAAISIYRSAGFDNEPDNHVSPPPPPFHPSPVCVPTSDHLSLRPLPISLSRTDVRTGHRIRS